MRPRPSLVPRVSPRRLLAVAPFAVAPFAVASLLVAPLAGCDLVDPLQREGTWRPTHAMDSNIAAQVSRPSILVRGVDYTPNDATLPTAAVDRYRAGRIRPLPDVNTAQIRSTGGGNDTGAGAGATGGTAGAAQAQ